MHDKTSTKWTRLTLVRCWRWSGAAHIASTNGIGYRPEMSRQLPAGCDSSATPLCEQYQWDDHVLEPANDRAKSPKRVRFAPLGTWKMGGSDAQKNEKRGQIWLKLPRRTLASCGHGCR